MTASQVKNPNGTHRGRPRIPRQIDQTVMNRCYSPDCYPDEAGMAIRLLPEEIELLKLIDVDGLMQEEATLRPWSVEANRLARYPCSQEKTR